MSELPTIAYLTAGGAGMFCGSCMRDNAMAAAMQRRGVDVVLVPLYTPIRTDEDDVSQRQIFFGGINVYLQQKLPLMRYVPRVLDRWLDGRWLLERLARRRIKVEARELGALTLSMLQGEHGTQRKEVERLVSWLAQLRPGLINLSNVLIAGCVPELKRRLKVPVVVTLQGDDLFLGDMAEPYRAKALAEIRRLADHIDGYITFSRSYADAMATYLGLPREKIHLVPLGLRSVDYRRPSPPQPPHPPTVGYLARMCPEKGFQILVDAFIELARMPGMDQVRLRAAGWLGVADEPFVAEQRSRLDAAGLAGRFDYAGVLDREEKVRFLHTLDVFSVPTTYREPKGLFALEALACGVPVVEPDHGAFPELLATTGGGKLFPPEDSHALAGILHELLTHPALRAELGRAGAAGVEREQSVERAADATIDAYRSLLRPMPSSPLPARSPSIL